MPQKKTPNQEDGLDTLSADISRTLMETLGYSRPTMFDSGGRRGLVVYEHERPAVFVYLVPPGQPITPEQQNLAELTASQLPQGVADFVWATNSADPTEGYFFSWVDERQMSTLPAKGAWQELTAGRSASAAKAGTSASDYKVLQKEFDDLHEYIYAARENVNGKNDITYELCKCIFLKMHLERHPDYVVAHSDKTLETILNSGHIQRYRERAVAEIKAAFASIEIFQNTTYSTTRVAPSRSGIRRKLFA